MGLIPPMNQMGLGGKGTPWWPVLGEGSADARWKD